MHSIFSKGVDFKKIVLFARFTEMKATKQCGMLTRVISLEDSSDEMKIL